MHQKRFCPKNRFFRDFQFAKQVFGLNFFRVHFLKFTFLKSVMERWILDTALTKFEEKKFSSLRRDKEYFLRTSRSKMQETAQYCEKQFFINRSSYSQSPYSFALRFLFLQTRSTSYSFYYPVTVYFKGERRKTR